MRFVAIGDSFTEGVGDEVESGAVRGWADLVAAGLAAGLDEPVHYANLAIRGRLLAPIATEQCEAALALDPPPDLVTIDGGGNDMLRPGWDLDELMSLVARVIDRTEGEGVRLVVLSGGDPSLQLPRGALMVERATQFMRRIDEYIEDKPHASVVDNLLDGELRRPVYWSEDRLHLNALGHARVAARVLTHLGVDTPLPTAAEPDPVRGGVLAQARYVGRYVLPWVGRRLTGRSSGDGRTPKHPEWVRMSAGA